MADTPMCLFQDAVIEAFANPFGHALRIVEIGVGLKDGISKITCRQEQSAQFEADAGHGNRSGQCSTPRFVESDQAQVRHMIGETSFGIGKRKGNLAVGNKIWKSILSRCARKCTIE